MDNLKKIFGNQYISTIITIFLALYAALLGPELPSGLRKLFNNTIFRIIILFLIVYRANKDPRLAIMIAVVFVLTLDFMTRMDAKEAFRSMNLELAGLNQDCGDGVWCAEGICKDKEFVNRKGQKKVRKICQ